MATQVIPSNYHGFDHLEFHVGNALQAATFYITRFGFKAVAYKGLETGCRDRATHVIAQNDIVFAFTSALNPDGEFARAVGQELSTHGDAVKDVAFRVDDARAIYNKAIERGAKSVREPTEVSDDNGSVVIATVQSYGQTVHSFIERKNYKGPFLPGFRAVDGDEDPVTRLTPPVGLQFVDHCVGNQPDAGMTPVIEWYEKVLGWHRFWSVDDSQIHTEYSALRSIVIADPSEKVKIPINEPALGKRKSQIQEFVEYHSGGGVQHIALNTDNIINAVTQLRARGLKFLRVPKTYYTELRKKLAASPVNVKENLDVLEELAILIDYDDKGYLLQLFTKPVEDRPTLFLEIIQRNNHQGFGAGNFKSLFEAIELDQAERGNLTDTSAEYAAAKAAAASHAY